MYPGLVQYSATGELNTVLYHQLPALLLNEAQKQHGQIEAQERQIKTQEQQIETQQKQLQAQTAQLAKLEARLE